LPETNCHRSNLEQSFVQMTRTLIVIPARMAATRLPGKPMVDIAGEPMIVHVWRRAMQSQAGRVVVAADSDEIVEAVRAAGGESLLTRPDHASGSDRIYEAVAHIDPEGQADLVVNLQGDLPTLEPDLVRACLAPLADAGPDIATLAAEIVEPEERTNPNVVKVVGTPLAATRRMRALYFTRASAPYGDGPLYHHIGIYAYRRPALQRCIELAPSPLERREKLEQLRALEAGMRIDVEIVDTVPLGVDTPADLERARRLLGTANSLAS
jgi:3-deoxy-manno-octulosonate cytidylyltransferase (CMP-KDO synthetase)